MTPLNKTPSRTAVGLTAIATVALVLRVGFYVVADPPFYDADAAGYLLFARDVLEGGLTRLSSLMHSTIAPLFPYLTAAVATVTGNLIVAGRLVSTAAGVGLVVLVYFLGSRAYGSRVGLVAAAIVAVNPILVELSFEPLTEGLYTTLIYAGILTALYALQQRHRWAFALTGVLIAAAYYVRAEGFLYVGLLLVMPPVVAKLHGQTIRDGLASAGVALAAFGIVTLPYLVALRGEVGYWTFSGRTTVMAEALMSEPGSASGWEQSRYALPSTSGGGDTLAPVAPTASRSEGRIEGAVVNWLVRRPLLLVRKALENLNEALRDVTPVLLSPFLVALVGLGLVAAPWTRARLAPEAVIVLLAAPMLLVPLIWVTSIRHYAGAVPLFALWAALGLEVVRARLNNVRAQAPATGTTARRWLPRVTFGLVLATVFGAELLSIGMLAGEKLRPAPTSMQMLDREFGAWMRTHLPEDRPSIAARWPYVALYADGRQVKLPIAELDATITEVVRRGARYLYVTDPTVAIRPQLAALLEPGFTHPRLTLLHAEQRGADIRLALYRLEPSPPE